MVGQIESTERVEMCIRQQSIARMTLRSMGFALLFVYGAWNLLHLFYRQVPSSLFLEFTGLPCPTTGGTRSLLALIHGDFALSLRWNPATLPLLLLAGATCVHIFAAVVKEGRVRLSDSLARSWMILLAVGWAVQIVQYLAGTFPDAL